jgi:deazaflavin-dependent oxidoreductase (nitroreductase family)
MNEIFTRLINWVKYTLIPWHTSLGITKGTITLEVVGRRSGQKIRVSVTMVRYAGQRYLVSLYDQSQWVKNVRAAGGVAILYSGRKTPVRLVEISPEDRAPILLGYVNQRAFSHSGAASARLFFGLGPNPQLEEMQKVAHQYPVFRIEEIKPG